MQMCHSGFDVFVISRLRTKAPDIKTTTDNRQQIDHSRSAIKKCIVPRTFDGMILYLSQFMWTLNVSN